MRETRSNQAGVDRTTSPLAVQTLANSPLAIGFILVALGVLLRENLTGPWPYLWFILLAAVAAAIAHRFHPFNRHRLLTWIICMAVVMFGIWLHASKLENIKVRSAQCPATDQWQPVHLRGFVVSIPKFRPDTSPFVDKHPREATVKPKERWLTAIDVQYHELVFKRSDRDERIETDGTVRVIIPGRHRDLIPGDAVDCYVKWRLIPPPSNPGEMDLAKRLRQQGIFAQASAKSRQQIQKSGLPKYWDLRRYLGMAAMAADRSIEEQVFFGQAPLAAALVLGQRDQIEWKLSESLLETGTIHMLAISGLHVEMVALSVGLLCLIMRISPRTTLVIVALIIVAYAFLCGANAPVLRAMFAVVLASFARFFGWTVNSYNLLSFAALCLLALRTDFLWDTGTQLSFLAVGVLIFVASGKANRRQKIDTLDALLSETDPWYVTWRRQLFALFRESIRVSSWVWLLTTPIILSTFHVISPIAIIMNFILIIPLWVGLLSGLLILVIGWLLPSLGLLFGFLCGSCLAFTELAIAAASQLPASHWWVPTPPLWWLLGFYLLLVTILLTLPRSKHMRSRIFVTMSLYLLFGCLPWGDWLPRELTKPWWDAGTSSSETTDLALTFVDVGHGTSVIVELPDGKTWLYDAGSMGNPERSFFPIANTLWHLHVRKIDRLFLSHADADHFNAIPALLKRFSVGSFCTTPQVVASNDSAIQPVLKAIADRGIPVEVYTAGDRIEADRLACSILHPSKDAFVSDNAASLSILMECNGRKVFLPGDLEGPGISQLLREPPVKIDVMMAPHHGSLSEDPAPLLGWSKPEHVIISGGIRAAKTAVLAAYAGPTVRDVWVTARDHALRVELDRAGKIEIKQWATDRWRTIESLPLLNFNELQDDELEANAF